MSDTISVKREDLEEWRRVLELCSVCAPSSSRIVNYVSFALSKINEYLKKEGGEDKILTTEEIDWSSRWPSILRRRMGSEDDVR